LVPDAEVFLVQAAPLLAQFDDGQVETWLLHPGGEVAFRLALRDEPAYRAWLDEAKPGKVRIIQRADGLEVQSAVGKLQGADPNGPTVPLRGGKLDVALLREGLLKLKARFESDELCVVPSFGTEVAKVAEVLSGNYREMGEPIFHDVCLVYPRPPAPGADAGRPPLEQVH
jgi:hypothetical protein